MPQLFPWYGYVQLIDIFPKSNSSESPPGYLPNLKFRYFWIWKIYVFLQSDRSIVHTTYFFS